ncbi:hypothetical protein BASA50_008017 [Batrachochytrium salamandrivorans]|uniref:Domain of unknown function at the cortex 1 domain-containing protein n=2 Tax=Batrachochytrium salamandrivorans TaxID=1357716 RepID=A0ABQ8F5F8_9FUNG|nr:hypothetical protein BASA50_008017 [Batrachochytrium salamandrivorans]KAJ1332398.1 hypothetical protein BSLG_008702 [Batrachochytrium salamandrivorans]
MEEQLGSAAPTANGTAPSEGSINSKDASINRSSTEKSNTTSKVADDFVLRVRAGPSYSELTTLRVNDEDNPFIVDSDSFTGFLVVRYLNFTGVVPEMDDDLAAASSVAKHVPITNASVNGHRGSDAQPQTPPGSDLCANGDIAHTVAATPSTKDTASQSHLLFTDSKASSLAAAATNSSTGASQLDSVDCGLGSADSAVPPPAVSSLAAINGAMTASEAVQDHLPSTGSGDSVRNTSTTGTPIRNPASSYFLGRNRRYSIMLQGRFKKEWKGDDIIFGVDMASPLRTPPGASIAIRIAKWLDPSIEADLNCSEPYIYSPMVSSMNSLAIFNRSDMPQVAQGLLPLGLTPPKPTQTQPSRGITGFLNITSNMGVNRDLPSGSGNPHLQSSSVSSLANDTASLSIPSTASAVPSIDIGPWAFGSRLVPEYTQLLSPSNGKNTALPTYDKRKKHFSDLARRNAAVFSPDNVYCMDFYDAYFDFNTVSLKLPGLSLSAFKYWDGQPLRYVAMSRDRSTVFFVVTFELVEKSVYSDVATFGSNEGSYKQESCPELETDIDADSDSVGAFSSHKTDTDITLLAPIE